MLVSEKRFFQVVCSETMSKPHPFFSLKVYITLGGILARRRFITHDDISPIQVTAFVKIPRISLTTSPALSVSMSLSR